jgi:hypothetical protein
MILLEREHIDYADRLAVSRRAKAIARNREQKHGVGFLSEAELLILDIIGARAEVAGYLLFQPTEWNRLHDAGLGKPDLAGFIDVKGVARPRDRLRLDDDDDPELAYLLIDGSFHPLWQPVGWLWGEEGKLPELRGNFGRGREDCFIVPRTFPPMRYVSELFDIVHKNGAQGRN